eukprot:CAMPEP_0119127678 /NCGR_PEP_ID=MMETSP1310-20130426/6135_1 /TAXON_ID=464262 /ORGANISM="Genus nov. species nov., Strain RCC2339" /LENGTH=45 /DNA_ID= /DNA_START= /DNA_END= /DNA_ORIENTATION=
MGDLGLAFDEPGQQQYVWTTTAHDKATNDRVLCDNKRKKEKKPHM